MNNIRKVFRKDREGWAYGLYITGDLFVGHLASGGGLNGEVWWYQDTPENRKKAEEDWKAFSFAKEVKV